MTKLIVANWKMNLGPAEAGRLLQQLDQKISSVQGVTVVLCPPFVDLHPLSQTLDQTKFKLGAQNLHQLDHGPYTGEISGAMLKGLVEYVIVGHSERRRAGESDQLIAQKVAAALRHDLHPILCVGETLTERQAKHSLKVVTDQLSADLAHVTAQELKRLIITYEPVWAISQGDGQGSHATPEQITPMITAIRSTLEALFGEAASAAVTLLYGGSVNPDDIGAYLKIPYISGGLVGGASLNYEEFAAIVAAARAAARKS